jgi:hypothetical protein
VLLDGRGRAGGAERGGDGRPVACAGAGRAAVSGRTDGGGSAGRAGGRGIRRCARQWSHPSCGESRVWRPGRGRRTCRRPEGVDQELESALLLGRPSRLLRRGLALPLGGRRIGAGVRRDRRGAFRRRHRRVRRHPERRVAPHHHDRPRRPAHRVDQGRDRQGWWEALHSPHPPKWVGLLLAGLGNTTLGVTACFGLISDELGRIRDETWRGNKARTNLVTKHLV